MSKYAAEIASNLRQIKDLNAKVRAMNYTMAQPQYAHLVPHLRVQIETATMQIGNLMFWVNHWMGAR